MFFAGGVEPIRGEAQRAADRSLTAQGQWIDDAKQGDVRAFNELVRLYQARAFRLAYRILGDADAASDATQEAFTLAFRHIRDLRGDYFQSWLMRIVANACYDYLRKKQARRESSLDGSADHPEGAALNRLESPNESPEAAAERRELRDLIERGLAALPYEQRLTLVLADMEGYSYEETADITLANLGTVKSRLARARASLRAFLIAQEGLLPRKYRQAEQADRRPKVSRS